MVEDASFWLGTFHVPGIGRLTKAPVGAVPNFAHSPPISGQSTVGTLFCARGRFQTCLPLRHWGIQGGFETRLYENRCLYSEGRFTRCCADLSRLRRAGYIPLSFLYELLYNPVPI